MEAVRRTQLAKGELGIHDRKPVPTLREFGPKFLEAVEVQCADKPKTVDFYKSKLSYLLASESLASSRLDAIDEAVIDSYKQTRVKKVSRRKKPLSVASVNRELATLRRLLRLAHDWKLINRVPHVRLLRGEHSREFVLAHDQEPLYLAACPEPLHDVAILLLDTGLRLGEALTLEGPEVHLDPANGAKFGYLTVLAEKAKNKRVRNMPLTDRVVEVLGHWNLGHGYVFHREDGTRLSETWLDQQHAQVRALLKFPEDFVLHSLRHTFGTRLAESGADAFTIMKLMGHSTVAVSQRYVHPSPESLERAVERLVTLNMQKVTTFPTTSAGATEGAVQ
jgi:integrase